MICCFSYLFFLSIVIGLCLAFLELLSMNYLIQCLQKGAYVGNTVYNIRRKENISVQVLGKNVIQQILMSNSGSLPIKDFQPTVVFAFCFPSISNFPQQAHPNATFIIYFLNLLRVFLVMNIAKIMITKCKQQQQSPNR